MNLKKLTIIGILFIFLLSSITHNLYDWFPSKLTALLFPVNESIWEHFKMIFTTTLIWGFVEYILLKLFKIKYNNLMTSIVLSGLTNIILTFLLFTPIYLLFGENLIVTLTIYFITTTIAGIIGYLILSKTIENKNLNFLSLVLILVIYIIFCIYTYYPPHIKILFYDYANKIYGIKK